MAGIYIHIPYCKQACFYCDFHFSTQRDSAEKMVHSIIRESNLRKTYLASEIVNTIYFGGGTPSILDISSLEKILKEIASSFQLSPDIEITLEANPDDLSFKFLTKLKSCGINRLSIGIQSFNDTFLKFMNRAHNAREASDCLDSARKAGFENISLDLIYGIQHPDHSIWLEDVGKAIKFYPEHLSCYCLTIEPDTVFGRRKNKGDFSESPETFQTEQFDILMNRTEAAGYDHYEISNFCRDNNYSKHNTSYWKRETYLGLGPGAHSFDGKTRQWNVSSNPAYINKLSKNAIPSEKEVLSRKDQINEFIMTGIRTKWGVDLQKLKSLYSYDLLSKMNSTVQYWVEKQKLIASEEILLLSKKGKLYADQIASDLFVTDES